MVIEQRVCPGCGGPVAATTERCEHCGAWFEKRGGERTSRLSSLLKSSLFNLPPDMGEFGVSGPLPHMVGLAVGVAIYGLGWALEDREYWLAPGAVATWAAALPLWLGLVALTLRTRRRSWPVGFAIALATLAVHLAIMWLTRGRFNDDMLGIAVVYAALALAGWLLGRLAHFALRRRRISGNRE